MDLKQKIFQKKAKIAICGLGYVGLPLAVELAKVGFSVFGLDMQKDKVKQVNQGKSYILDVESEDLKKVVSKGNLKAISDSRTLGKTDVIIICVPTPLTKHKEPDISYVKAVTQDIAKNLKKGQLVILESTTYPGTTREVILPALAKSGLKVGKDFYLAFSPERVDPGNKQFKTKDIPKVVGGMTKKCTDLAALVYSSFIKQVHKVSSPETAEMTKLLENIFRIVNISAINELALLCDKMKIDIWEVIEAAKTKPYGFMAFYPGPGIGGHCIPLDPFYLSWKAKEHDFYARFIELASEINVMMPHYVITKITYALNQQKKPVAGSKILVLGVAYKKDVADVRESPVLKIIQELLHKRAKVLYHDPYVQKIKLENKILNSSKLSSKLLSNVDCVLIATDHSTFDFNKIAKQAKLIVDTRNGIKERGLKHVYRI